MLGTADRAKIVERPSNGPKAYSAGTFLGLLEAFLDVRAVGAEVVILRVMMFHSSKQSWRMWSTLLK